MYRLSFCVVSDIYRILLSFPYRLSVMERFGFQMPVYQFSDSRELGSLNMLILND